MPSVQGVDAFDHGFDVPADYDALFGTPTAVTTPLYQDRLNSLEINSPGNEGVRKNITGSPSRGWMGFAVRKPSNPAGDVTIAAIHSVTSNIQARVVWDAGGNLDAYIGAGTRSEGPAVAADTFVWVEMIYNVIAATHVLLWRVNGVDQSNSTVSATGSDSVNYGQLVSLSGDQTLTWYAGGYWAWGSASSDSDWLGEPAPVEKQTYYGYRRRSYR